MAGEALARQIRALVDHLRQDRETPIGLADIASVTEVLITTMSAFFKSIDVSVYREFKELTDYLQNARQEIAQLTPKDLEATRIPRAGQELAAIVQSTEKATNDIMGAAEAIMAAVSDNEAINDACMCIFEACSFQDITGQRISKVVNTLEHVEGRILQLKGLFEVEGMDDADPSIARMDGDVALHGPALDGEGMDQSAVDDLLGNGAAAKPEAATEPEAAAEPKAAPEPEAVAKPEAAPAADVPDPAAAGVEPDSEASQADIDAMFN